MSELHSRAQPERARRTVLADESGWRQLAVGERDRNVGRVERVADPALCEEELAANAAAEVHERVGVLTLRVRFVVLEGAGDPDVGAAVGIKARVQRPSELRSEAGRVVGSIGNVVSRYVESERGAAVAEGRVGRPKVPKTSMPGAARAVRSNSKPVLVAPPTLAM